MTTNKDIMEQIALVEVAGLSTVPKDRRRYVVAMIMAQCHHESAGFTRLVENLNYSEQALERVFGRYFRSVSAAAYARKPERIANRVYANRMGNGDADSGDGWRYRGRGFIQLTGKDNYKNYSAYANFDYVSAPDLLTDPLIAADVAMWYFTSRKGLLLASIEGAVERATLYINGGRNGLAHREKLFTKYLGRYKYI